MNKLLPRGANRSGLLSLLFSRPEFVRPLLKVNKVTAVGSITLKRFIEEPSMEAPMPQCSRCKTVKPATEFYVNKRGVLENPCVECGVKSAAERRRGCGRSERQQRLSSSRRMERPLPCFLQALANRLLEHGLIANASLFCDPPGTLKVSDRDAKRNGASCPLLGLFDELFQDFRIGLRDFQPG